MCPARARCTRNARDEQDRDQAELRASTVVIRAPPRQGFYPVTPEKRENAEDAGQNSYRDLDPEQQDLVAPHAPSPASTGDAGSWRLAWSPGLVLSRDLKPAGPRARGTRG